MLNQTFIHVTGLKLNLIFNPQGALSNAKFGGTDVTGEVRFLKESDDNKQFLRPYGFYDWTNGDILFYSKLNEMLNAKNLAILNVVSIEDSSMASVALCLLRDEGILIRRPRCVLTYNKATGKFGKIMKVLDTDYKKYQDLTDDNYGVKT